MDSRDPPGRRSWPHPDRPPRTPTLQTDAGMDRPGGDLSIPRRYKTLRRHTALKPNLELLRLQSLGLNGTNVTDAGLEHLKGLTELTRLALYDTKVSDLGLRHLKGLTHLKRLCIRGTDPHVRSCGTKVPDAELEHLKGL